MATPVDIIGGFYTVGGRSWAAQDCVNYLPMAAEVSGTKTQTMLRTPPGLRPWVKVGDGPDYAIRGMHDVEGMLFVVSGSKLYQISNKGVAIPLGTVPGVGRVSMAHNQIAGGNQLLVVNGNGGYVWNTLTQTFRRVTDEGYPGSSVAQFINSYIMQLEPFGRFLFFSDLADATEYNTLDRFEAEAQPDPIVSILTDQNEVVAFGTRTMQFFENTGAAQGTFQSKGVVISRGCAGRFTPVKIDNSIAWLGDDGVFYRLDGYSPRRISTHAIEEAIAGLDWSQAFGMVWTDQGHAVAYWTFPDGQTWGYDVSSGLWHRRASYHPTHEVSRRWRLSSLVRSNGKWIGGDATSGKLFVLDWDYMLEDEDQPLVSERVTQVAFNSGSRFSVDAVELWMRTGGKLTESLEFPAQPVGPTISGEAPSGSVGMAYGPFQYAVIAGDNPIKSVAVVSGSLPPGLTLSNTGELVGVPITAGSFSWVVRAADTEGLWSEVQNSMEISVSWLLTFDASIVGARPYEDKLWISANPRDFASASVHTRIPNIDLNLGSNGGGYTQLANDVVAGVAFDGQLERFTAPDIVGSIVNTTISSIAASTFVRLKRFGEVCAAMTSSENAYYTSTDAGLTWTRVVLPGPTTTRFSDVSRLNSGRWVADSNAANGFYYSDDEVPVNWLQAAGPVTSNSLGHIATNGKVAVKIGSLGRVFRTIDGITWQEMPVRVSATMRSGAASGDTFVFCANSGTQACRSTDGGITFFDFNLPFNVKRVDVVGDMWVFATTGGGIYYSDDDALTLHPAAMPIPYTAGDIFYACPILEWANS